MKKNNKKVVKGKVDISKLVMAIAILVFGVVMTLIFENSFNLGKYKEGTYLGVDNDSKETAVIYVDNNGKIRSVFIDAAYLEYDSAGACKYTKMFYGKKQCVSTTKQMLKDDYGMKNASAVKKEWYEQANEFANKIVEEQGLDWVGTIKNDAAELNVSSIDGVSSVTMDALGMYKAVNNALEQAKK